MTPFSTKAILASFLCFTSVACVADANACPQDVKHARASVRHIEGGGIGYNQGYTTLEVFLASDPDRWSVMPFLDMRGHLFDNGKWAANAGAGIRGISGCRAYGLNTFYDYRNTKKIDYNQFGFGLETLGNLWDLRINGYVPFGKKISSPYDPKFDKFSGHEMIITRKYQFTMRGADAEMGFHFGKSRSFDFYAAAGPYYYIGEVGGCTWGGKARLSGKFKEYITLEISDSYDQAFRNNFQGQISFSLPFGPKSSSKKKRCCNSCTLSSTLTSRMVQPVEREEIIVARTKRKSSVAKNAATGLPLYFVFVDNTSHSLGTFESPYPTLALAEENSKPGDIIYVFPGNGTTEGMASGIFLQADQKFWGSGVSHLIQTSAGGISIPAQSSSLPTITNTDSEHTVGNVITLASNNSIEGFIITSAYNDAIYGTDAQNLEVSSCVITNTTTFAIEATFSGDASIAITNNQFLDNTNGIFLTLNGTSTVVCLDNTFTGQTSVSSAPLEIAANSNSFAVHIKNNIFEDNTTGSIRFNLNEVVNADITVLNNRITNNRTGSQASLGSSLVILQGGAATDHCSITLKGNTFSENQSNALYLHTAGAFTTLEATVSENMMSDNGGSGLVFATPTDNLTLVATNNTIVRGNDNGIAVISSGSTSVGNITLTNNILTDIGNASNGIAINQDFSGLSLTILNNEINRCEGTGVLSYAPTGIDSFILNVSGNTISNCQNNSSNAAGGIDVEQYTNLTASITNNTLSNNTTTPVVIGSTLAAPTACVTLTGNSSNSMTGDDYFLTNPVGRTFYLTPCNVNSVNTGGINAPDVTLVQSCSNRTACPP